MQNPANSSGRSSEDAHGRQPFTHPALEGLDSLTNSTKMMLTSRLKVAGLAQKYGMHNILRWSPRKVSQECTRISFSFLFFFFPPLLLTIGSVKPENLANSGMDLILAHTMYAVVGAIALEKGGYMANKMAQERILEPLGVKTIS